MKLAASALALVVSALALSVSPALAQQLTYERNKYGAKDYT